MTSYIRHRIRHILTNIPNSKFRETRRRITSNSPQEFYTHRFASRHRHDACARARSRLLDRAREHLYARADSAIARTGTRTATQQRCGRSSTPTPSDDASSASSSPPSRPRALLSATHAKLTDIQRYSRTPVPVNHSASSHPHMHGDDERRRPHHLPRPPPGHAHRARSLACPTRHFPTNRDTRAYLFPSAIRRRHTAHMATTSADVLTISHDHHPDTHIARDHSHAPRDTFPPTATLARPHQRDGIRFHHRQNRCPPPPPILAPNQSSSSPSSL